MNEIQRKEVLLGDEKAIQWIIEDKNGFIIWSTFDKEIMLKQQLIIENRNHSTLSDIPK